MKPNILSLIISLNNSFLSELETEKLIQDSINEIVEKLELLGGIIFMIDKDTIFAHTISGGEIAQRFIQFIGMPINNLSISKDHPENLIAKSIREEKIFYSTDLKDFTVGVLSPFQANFAQLITQTKSAVAIPLISHDEILGAIFLSSWESEVLLSVKDELQVLAASLGIALKNSQLFKQLQESRDKLKATLSEVNRLRKAERETASILIHNLKNPLTAMLSATEMLKENIREQRNITLLELSSKSLNNILEILDKAYVNVQTDKKEKLYIEQFNIHQTLDEIITTFDSAAKAKGLKYISSNHVGKEHTIQADRLKFNQIFENLISNAIKYTQSGTVRISSRVYKKKLVVEITDTGVGISEEELKHLGKKFFRGVTATTASADGENAPSGSGLGLYAARKYLEILGGDLIFTSRLGVGTTARVELML